MNKGCATLVLLLILAPSGFGQIAGYPDFELVESTPVETTLDNPDVRDALDVWLEMFRSATTSLDIEQFYIANQKGEPLEPVVHSLLEAAERGVQVRIIVDSRMYRTYPETVDSLSRVKNIATRIIDFGRIAGGIQHAKFFIVDGEQIFLGSQNFDWRALKHIHELGLRIRNRDAVQIYQDIFDLDWRIAERNDPGFARSILPARRYDTPLRLDENGEIVTVVPTCSPKDFIIDTTLWDEPNLVRLIDSARFEVALQFLGYTTKGRDKSIYPVLDDALRRAAGRGVRVHLIVSDWEKATPAEIPLKDLVQVPHCQVKFSTIPDWSGGYIPFGRVEHCKYVVADSRAFWLGTSNAEKSYFHTSRNLGIIVNNARLASLLRRIFMKSWDGPYCEPIDPARQYSARRHGEK